MEDYSHIQEMPNLRILTLKETFIIQAVTVTGQAEEVCLLMLPEILL